MSVKRLFLVPLFMALNAATVFSATMDPVPYDSIANPLSKLPQTDTSVQRRGDLLNMKPSRVRVNQAGYRVADLQLGFGKFYYVGSGLTFKVITYDSGKDVAGSAGSGVLVSENATVSGQVIANASNSAEHANNGIGDWRKGYPMTGQVVSGNLMQGVLSGELPRGRYRIVVNADTSAPFAVSDNVYGMARDAALKFFGVARSGDYGSWFHQASHLWDGWLYDSAARDAKGNYKYKGALTGGWYDCGNHLKEARTNSYPLAALGMMAATNLEKDADHYALNQAYTVKTDGVPDVLREAWVGAQFVLKSFRLAKGITDSMYLSVPNPRGGVGPLVGVDFNWWGRPENQDNVLSPNRGGRFERPVIRNWGTPSMADFSAGMAFLGRLYRPYDSKFADTALIIAKAMYAQAVKTNGPEGSSDYSGETKTNDDLAMAAVALLWATQDVKYLNDLAYSRSVPDGNGKICADPNTSTSPLKRFDGGYLGCGSDGITKYNQTEWADIQSLPLYTFMKLILVNADTAAHYGITSAARRDTLAMRCMNNLIPGTFGVGNGTITLPTGENQYNHSVIHYDTTWYDMMGGDHDWYNKYQFGYLADLYMYYDAAGVVEGKPLLGMDGGTDWKRKEVLQALLGGLDYMFGMNALDLSFIYGIGTKNPNHPHHRAANPEGKNVPGAYYNYAIPVGGLYGGIGAANKMVLTENWSTYQQTEANCPDASAAEIIPLMGLAKVEVATAPIPTVKVLYTTDTLAVVEVDLDKWGTAKLAYGKDSTIASMTNVVTINDTSNTFTFKIHPLTSGTKYWFMVTTANLQGQTATQRAWPNSGGDSIPYTFTTKDKAADNPIYGNIKVCNVTADSAEIMWYTPNGEYLSSVLYADSASWKAGKYSEVDTDIAGNIPVTFHRVKISGLSPKTTYYFKVGVPGSYDTTVGCFKTPNEDVKFDVRASGYLWNGLRSLTIGVTNQDVKDYDSLEIRLYVTGTAANVWDLGARCDIGIKYRSDGYQDAGFAYVVDQNLRKSHPKKIDSSCTDAEVCQWYFDIPIWGATMESQARFRLDIMWDKHKVEMSQPPNSVPVLFDDLMNTPPSHDIFDTANHDWSFRKHVAGGDGGMSPVDYSGVKYVADISTKNIMDEAPQTVEIDPYIAVYRRNDFIYGYSPSRAEQATKRTVMAMDVTLDAPFDQPNGNTITIPDGVAPVITGTINAYDQLTPASKGYITGIWVNGAKLSDDVRRSALTRQTDGTWKLKLPLKLATGTNKVDVTFFASIDSVEDNAEGVCSEGKGCAFYNGNWYVNYVSTQTYGILDLFNGQGKTLKSDSTLALGADSVIFQVNDADRDKNSTLAETIDATVRISHKGASWNRTITLTETGPSTGIFRSIPLDIVIDDGKSDQNLSVLPMTGPDTVFFSYADPTMVGDTGTIRAFTRATFPNPGNGNLVAPCAGGIVARIPFDMALPSKPDSVRFAWTPPGATDADTVLITDTSKFSFTDATSKILEVDLSSVISENTSATGTVDIHVPSQLAGYHWAQATLADSIGPKLLQVQVYENFGTGPDTLRIVFSEKPKFSKTWPFLFKSNTGTFTVDSAWEDSAAIHRYMFIVEKSAGASLTAGKDSLKLVSDASVVSDTLGNAASDCQTWTGLGLYTRPVPIHAAWLKDADGNGRADKLYVTFSRALLAREIPDSFVVSFGTTGTDTLRAALTWTTTDSITFVAALDSAFPVSATQGTGLNGGGALWVSRSGFIDWYVSSPVIDSVGANALSARLHYGIDKDTLILALSENVESAGTSAFAVKVGGSDIGSAVRIVGSTAYIVVDTGTLIPMVDSVRVGVGLSDLLGNLSGAKNPAVLVKGGDRPPVSAWFVDGNGDGTVDSVVLTFPRTLHTLSSFVFRWPDRNGNLISVPVPLPVADTGNTIVVRLAVPGMDSLVTGYDTTHFVPSSLGMMIDSTTGDTMHFAVSDHVAPTLISASLRYNEVDGQPDTLKLSFSEAVFIGKGDVTVLNTAGNLVRYLSAVVNPGDAKEVWLFIDSTQTFSKRDSLGAAPLPIGSLSDLLGNQPSMVGRWVYITFGTRKPIFNVTVQNPILNYTGWLDASPNAATPSITLLASAPNGSWQTLDGTVLSAQDALKQQGMGVVITLNQAINGFAYIYDNLGTYVAGIDLSKYYEAWSDATKVPKSAADRTQLWIRWDGRSANGTMASTGVYTLRLVTRRSNGTSAVDAVNGHYINQLYKMGWKRKP